MNFVLLANRHLCDVPIYEPGRPIEEVARQLRLAPSGIIKLASNENALGPSPRALQAMRRALDNAHRYPDGGGFFLRRELAAKLGVQPENLILGAGSNEILEFLFHTFVAPGDEVVVGDRAFIIYSILARLFQARCVSVPFRQEHTHDLGPMLAAISPRTKLVFVANPNNPSGTRVDNVALTRFIRRLPAHVICVLDEAYLEYLDAPPPAIDWALRRKVVVLRTFSKIHGLAALRLGYGIAQPSCIELMQRVRQPFNTNSLAQAGALAALEDDRHVDRTRQMTREGLAYLYGKFDQMGLAYVPSHANFVLVRVGTGQAVFEALQRHGVIVRPLGGYRLPEWVRVTVGRPQENRRFIAALKTVLTARH